MDKRFNEGTYRTRSSFSFAASINKLKVRKHNDDYGFITT